jgi:hypothetical protein
LEVGGNSSDIEEGHKFGIFGTFDDDSLVGIDPLSKTSGGFELMLGYVVEEDRAITLEDLITDGVQEIKFTSNLFPEGDCLSGGVHTMPVLVSRIPKL